MKIVILDGGTLNPGDIAWSVLDGLGEISVYDSSLPEQLSERASAADIIIVNKFVIGKDELKLLPRLRYIAVSATGYNNVDTAACKEQNVQVSNVVNYGSDAVAQHAFALLLALTNRPFQHYLQVKDGEWERRNVFSFWNGKVVELSGKTFGIAGMGNIARKAAAIAAGFGMRVIYHSAGGHTCENAVPVSLDELARQSDVISLHTHLNEKNAEMIDRSFLSKMKDSAYLINTSRGGLINESDLAEALRTGTIAGAGLDVLSQEPPPDDHILLNCPNCIITPHNAWASVEARTRMMYMLRDNIASFLDGNPNNLVC